MTPCNSTRRSSKLVSRKPCSLDKSIVTDDVPIQVIPGLFIGSVHCAFNEVALQKAGITHIVNAAGLPATFPHLFQYLTISLRDKDYANLLACIPIANSFITAALSNCKKNDNVRTSTENAEGNHGSVLVHCSFGRSRSAALVIAYLMQMRRLTFQDAYNLVKQQRPVVAVNPCFQEQLAAFERAQYDVHRAHQQFVRARLKDMAERRKDPRAPWKLLKGHQPAMLTLRSPRGQQVVVLPTLVSMDLEFVCLQCKTPLFYASDVLKPLDDLERTLRTQQRRSDYDDTNDEGEEEEEEKKKGSVHNKNCTGWEDLRCEDQKSGNETDKFFKRRGFHSNLEKTRSSRSSNSKLDYTPPKLELKIPHSQLNSPMKRSSSAQSLLSLCSEQSESEPLSARSVELCLEAASKTHEQKTEWIEKMCQVTCAQNNLTLSSEMKQLIETDMAFTRHMLTQDSVLLSGPLTWMKIERHQDRGTLCCPECSTYLGAYDLETSTYSGWNESFSPFFKVDASMVGTRTQKIHHQANLRCQQRPRTQSNASSGTQR